MKYKDTQEYWVVWEKGARKQYEEETEESVKRVVEERVKELR